MGVVWGSQALVLDGQLPNEEVERRSEVIDHIANECSPIIGRGIPNGFPIDERALGINIWIDRDLVRVTLDETAESIVQDAEVLVCSTLLGPDTGKGVVHTHRLASWNPD